MKKIFSIIFILTINIPYFLYGQNSNKRYKTEVVLDSSLYLTTFLTDLGSPSNFLLHSPKNADVRLVGGLKARVARVFKKSPKKGIILKMKGDQKGDSIIGELNIAYIGKFHFKGIKTESRIQGVFTKDSVFAGTIEGYLTNESRIDHSDLSKNILDTIHQFIYSKKALKTESWINFEKGFKKVGSMAHDDLELLLWFFSNTSKLSFSHIYLIPNPNAFNDDAMDSHEKGVVFEEKGASTAYLKIDNFSSTTEELEEILPIIIENENFKHLIIDLRDNPGGGIEAANALGRYLFHGKINVGYFPTQKFLFENDSLQALERLPEIDPKSTEEFVDLMKITQGAKLVMNNSDTSQIFKGKIYILVNNGTASTCEPIVYYFKSNNLATIIGETTAGVMLSASAFLMNEKFNLMIPVADYFTPDLRRLDQIGVTPNVVTKSEDALDKALKLISGMEN